MFNHYNEKRALPIYALENLEGLHAEYKALGGNGTVDSLVRQLFDFPVDASHLDNK